MSPQARFVAYYRVNNELVVDSAILDVEEELPNQVRGIPRKNAQVVTNLQQTCSNAVPTTCQQDVRTACSQLVDKLLTACWQLATRSLSSTDLLQLLVPTT
jgi:hypothetical protein